MRRASSTTGIRVMIEAVGMEMLGNVSKDEARREGFDSVAEFMAAFREINGDGNGWTAVWRVQFIRLGEKLNPYTEGDGRIELHATACGRHGGCRMSCRCWCHGITRHMNGALRRDARS